jgi:2-amino-4-hydroxy-6-hydroxymethyldihydropteridine diphosphokinase
VGGGVVGARLTAAPAWHAGGDRAVNEVGYLGLGSNVGERRENLQAAVELLWAHEVTVLASSSVYETEPVGEVLDQRAFYNACLRVETGLGPERLLDACKAVERALGRAQSGEDGYVRHGPRALDVDVLLLDGRRYRSERLTLPHREVTSRRFVLVPLLELAPALVVPGAGPAARALAALEGQAVRRAGPPLDVGP